MSPSVKMHDNNEFKSSIDLVKQTLDNYQEDEFNELRKETIDMCLEKDRKQVPECFQSVPKRKDIDNKWHVGALAAAMFNSNLPLFEDLLTKNLKPHGRFKLNDIETTLLHEAALNRAYIQFLNCLIERMDVLIYTKHRDAPLYLACEVGNDLGVEILMKSMLDKSDTRSFELVILKSLCKAAKNGHLSVVRLIVEKYKMGIELDLISEKLGLSVIHNALENQQLEVVKEMCTYKCSDNLLKQLNPSGLSPLCYVCSASLPIEYLITLIKAGADLNYSHVNNNIRMDALKYAAKKGEIEKLRLLLKHGAKISEDPNEISALMLTCHSWSGECAQILLDAGAKWKDPQRFDENNKMKIEPVEFAVRMGAPDVLLVLIKKGAVLWNNLLYHVCKDHKPNGSYSRVLDILLENKLDATLENDEQTCPIFECLDNQGVKTVNNILIMFLKYTPALDDGQAIRIIQHICTSKPINNLPYSSLMLLHYASYPVVESIIPLDLELPRVFSRWLMEQAGIPPSLRRLSRITIRKRLGCVSLKTKIKRLPLPKLLINYLQMDDLYKIVDWISTIDPTSNDE